VVCADLQSLYPNLAEFVKDAGGMVNNEFMRFGWYKRRYCGNVFPTLHLDYYIMGMVNDDNLSIAGNRIYCGLGGFTRHDFLYTEVLNETRSE